MQGHAGALPPHGPNSIYNINYRLEVKLISSISDFRRIVISGPKPNLQPSFVPLALPPLYMLSVRPREEKVAEKPHEEHCIHNIISYLPVLNPIYSPHYRSLTQLTASTSRFRCICQSKTQSTARCPFFYRSLLGFIRDCLF